VWPWCTPPWGDGASASRKALSASRSLLRARLGGGRELAFCLRGGHATFPGHRGGAAMGPIPPRGPLCSRSARFPTSRSRWRARTAEFQPALSTRVTLRGQHVNGPCGRCEHHGQRQKQSDLAHDDWHETGEHEQSCVPGTLGPHETRPHGHDRHGTCAARAVGRRGDVCRHGYRPGGKGKKRQAPRRGATLERDLPHTVSVDTEDPWACCFSHSCWCRSWSSTC
jgi:hypothetical protein